MVASPKNTEQTISINNFKIKNMETEKIKKWDNILKRYLTVRSNGYCFVDIENNKMLYRIETHGRTGKVLFRNLYYIFNNTEKMPAGLDGSTGFGWGGRIIGYLTEEEIQEINLKIK